MHNYPMPKSGVHFISYKQQMPTLEHLYNQALLRADSPRQQMLLIQQYLAYSLRVFYEDAPLEGLERSYNRLYRSSAHWNFEVQQMLRSAQRQLSDALSEQWGMKTVVQTLDQPRSEWTADDYRVLLRLFWLRRLSEDLSLQTLLVLNQTMSPSQRNQLIEELLSDLLYRKIASGMHRN